MHRLIVNATDNAGNVSEQELTFDVRHGSPVPVGPGTVDPTTGQLKLSATDVSLAGAGAVSRVYESRNLTAGAGGPLGPQWAIGLGGGEGLTVLPEGSVVLASSAGGTTTFTRNEKGEFESPLGDGNVKIEAKEKVPGKGITEYLLKDTTAGTTTVFEQPSGTELTMPVYTNQFGVQGGAQLNHPSDVAIDSSGNEWVADYYNGRIVKFSPAGVLLASYGIPGQWLGEFKEPRAIAINQSTGNVYVSDEGNSRIVELNSSGAFTEAFGWGVSNGKEEFQTCTSYCRAGIAGSGNGQFREPKGLAVDSSGNVWVVDSGNSRIQEFTGGGEYKQKFGSAGSGEGQFKNPRGLAFAGGNLYVAEVDNDRVQELSTAGKYVGQLGTGKEGTGNSEFKYPTGVAVDPISGNIYVSDGGNNRVQEFTSAGKFITKFGAAGSGSGQFSEPKGLAVSSSGGIYVTDYNNNRVQEWTRPSWLPTRSEGSLKSATTTYAYRAVEEEEKTVLQPTEAVAPAPAGMTCTKPEEKTVGEALSRGCRALLFEYAGKTMAGIGEGPSEWGEYNGHLTKVFFKAYNPAAGSEKMEEKTVAEYAYDKQGRLRAEWDPRISPALKTTYGYDEEGHVTSVSSAGQEPWLLHYGALGGDASTGRLLSVAQPAAVSKETLKEQAKMAVPVNTEKPTLSSTSPEIGTLINATSEGKWSNSPLAYSFQWEDCHLVTEPEATVCVPILGAVNQSYTPQASDAGFKLVVQVTAENINGAKAVTSGETKAVPMPAPSYSKTYGKAGSENGQFKDPAGAAVDSEGNIWIADLANNRVQKLSSSGSFIGAYSPDSMLEPEGIAVNPINNDMYVTNRGRNRVDVLSPTGVLVNAFGGEGTGPGLLKSPDQIAIDPRGDVWVDDTANNRIEEFSASGAYISSFGGEGSGHGQFKSPTGIAICNNTVYVTDQGNERIQEFSLEGKWLSQFGHEGKGNGEFSYPSQIACEPVGNDIYVSDKSNNRIEEFNATGTFLDTFSGSGETQLSTPIGVAVAPNGVVYVGDYGNGRIEKWTSNYSTSNPVPSPPSVGTTSVSTIDYHVPLSGVTGLQNLTKGEVAKWGQKKDDPTEGMAIFPPDEPMGWPAKDYNRASITYMDEQARTVNTTSPSGAVSTTEYNEINDVVRTLSADNRAVAMKEGSESAQIAKSEELDMKSTYNAEGTEMLETLGPEHEVKLSSGSEVQARDHVKYSYSEGAPEGKEYSGLVTKTTDAALVSGKEEDLRTTITSYSGQKGLGWKLRKPTSVTTDPSGLNLTHTTIYDETTGNVIETRSPGGQNTAPVFGSQFGSAGSGSGQFEAPMGIALDGKGDVVVADEENARVDVFKEGGEFVKSFGSWGTEAGKFLEVRGVAVDTKGNIWTEDQGNNRVTEFNEKGEYVKTVGSAGTGAKQFKEPKGIAIDVHNNVWVTDTGNNRIEKFNEKGEFVSVYGFGVSNGEEKFESCTSSCRAGNPGSGHGQFEHPRELATDAAGNVWVTDTGNNRVEELNEKGEFIKAFGSTGAGNGQFKEPKGITVDAQGYVWVTDAENNRIEKFNGKGEYVTKFGSEGTEHGQFHEPWGIQINGTGEIFVSDTRNNRIEKFTPIPNSGNPEAHNTQTVYYSAAANPTVAACGEHPEWANLPCQTQPAAQPEDGLILPTSLFTYNVWDETETTTETFGTTKRKKIQSYDSAGRALTSEIASTIDAALPKVTNEYNTETGALENQSVTEKGETKTITSKLNTLGQLTSYTDADKNTTTYEYEPDADDRLTGINDGKGTQTYAYDPTTGFLNKLIDSAAGTFTASYDVEGKMLTEAYPNGMTATNTLNPLGQTTGLAYEKNAHCATKCPETWFSDTVVPSIHGETLAQTSTLAKESYTYDNAGRLTQTQEEPTGEACTTRLYAYDEESNRTSLTTRKGSEGKCATEGGTVERHTYDTANRLTDSEVAYETFGNTTTLPAADAGGKYAITSNYYVDNQIASQTQNEKTLNYHYDPAGRARETETVVKGKTESTMISHYSGPGEAVTWTSEGAEKWSRNIPGIDGALDAIQTSSGTTTLQLHDLQGNIIATAGTSETETKLLTTYNSTEFGVPGEGKTPPKYAWLGATGVTTELAAGVATKGGASYVPQIARNLQTAPVVPPGAFPNGQGSGSPYISEVSGWSAALSQAQSAEAIAEELAKQEAARKKAEEACEASPMSCVVLGDPEPKVDYLTFREATLKAFEIRALISEGDEASIESLFFDLAGAAKEAVEGLFTGEADKKWDEFVAGKLEYCVSELKFWGVTGGGCRVSTPTVEILGGSVCLFHHCVSVPGIALPDLSKDPEVSMCAEWVDSRLGECIYLGS